jgi:hypothetical protein
MKTISESGWPVVQSCIVTCQHCGESNVDQSCGTPVECVRSARANGWRLVNGRPTCDRCVTTPTAPQHGGG